MADRPADVFAIADGQPMHDRVLPLFRVCLEKQAGQGRSDEHGEDERSEQREGDGPRHRLEEFSLDSLESKDRKVGGDDDGNRVKHGALDFMRGFADAVDQAQRRLLRTIQMADDVLDHDDRTVDDHAEVKCAEAQKVRGDVAEVKTDGGEEQSKWDREGNDDGAADIAQKNKEDDDNQDHSFGEIVQDRVGCVVNQIVAVQIGDDLYARRQNLRVEAIDHGVEMLQHGCGVATFAQEDDALHDIVVIFNHAVGAMESFADLTEANLGALGDDGDVSHAYRSSGLSLENGLFDVVNVSDEADGAHVDLLRALLDEAAAGVGVGIGKLLLYLREAEAVGDELVGIETYLIFTSDAAEGGVVDNIRHGADVLGDDPILQRLHFHQVIRRIGALHGVPVDGTDGAEIGTDASGDTGRERDLRKTLQTLLTIPIVVGIVVKDQVHHRQARQRSGANMLQVRDSVHLNLDGNGDLLLDFFGGASGPLRDDLHPGVGHVGIGFDGQIVEGDHTPDKEEQRCTENDEAVVEGKIDEEANHCCSAVFWNSRALATTC